MLIKVLGTNTLYINVVTFEGQRISTQEHTLIYLIDKLFSYFVDHICKVWCISDFIVG